MRIVGWGWVVTLDKISQMIHERFLRESWYVP